MRKQFKFEKNEIFGKS